MRKREVIELRYRIDCVGWSCASNGHQQGAVDMQDCENTPESKSTAHLTLLCLSYPGGLSGSAGKRTAVGSIGQAPRPLSHARPNNTGAP